MASEDNSCYCSFPCFMFGCFATTWAMGGLLFLIIGFIAIVCGYPASIGLMLTVISICLFILGCSMWYCLVKRLNEFEKVNSMSNQEFEAKCVRKSVRIKRSIASFFIGFGILSYVVGLLLVHLPSSSGSDRNVQSGQTWTILWMVVSLIPIVIGCSLCCCIEKERRERLLDRSDKTDTTIIPQINAIEMQVAKEPMHHLQNYES